jgi:hypothetical protein
MQDDKPKVWFVGYTRRLWMPVSWEGYLWLGSAIGLGVLAAVFGRERGGGSSLPWAAILALAAYVGAFYWFTRGHVDKRY